jgi:hypothetical protein
MNIYVENGDIASLRIHCEINDFKDAVDEYLGNDRKEERKLRRGWIKRNSFLPCYYSNEMNYSTHLSRTK